MKVISTPSKKIKCHKCYTILEITNEDLIERKDSNKWFIHGRYFTQCPVCGEEISFKEMIKEGGEQWNMIYKYAVLPFATGNVRDAVSSGKWIAGELAESALMELSKLNDKTYTAVRMTVVVEWQEEEEGGEQ